MSHGWHKLQKHTGTLHFTTPVVQSTGGDSSSPEHTSVDHAESAQLSQTRLWYHLFPPKWSRFKFTFSPPSVGALQLACTLTCVYATNIFLQFECLIQPFICCQQNIKACRVLEADKTVWKDENYNYCHWCPTKTALRCFSSPCLSPNVTTYRVKMESWGHCWSSLTTSCILSYF